MRKLRPYLASLVLLVPLMGCKSATEAAPPEVLLEENFDAEHSGTYSLNYTSFSNWEVSAGSVDLVGTWPYDDFLPTSQGLYVDLDGTTASAGTLRSRTSFDLQPGTYRLRFRMAGTPRPDQPANTVNVSVGSYLQRTLTLSSYAPLTDYSYTFTVTQRGTAQISFQHLGGDNYGNFIDDIRFERL
jgi:hypothetical protein